MLTVGIVLMVIGMLLVDNLPITAGTLIIIGGILLVMGAKKTGNWIK